MSDDPYKSFDHHIKAQEAEITRLRAAINDALTAPFPDPELNSTWHQEPIGPNETPEEAIKRLVSVRAEWEVHKNNCENPVIAELRAEIATARREGMEEAAQIAENEPEPEGEPPIELHGRSVKNIAISSVRATKHSIAAAIRAAAGGEVMIDTRAPEFPKLTAEEHDDLAKRADDMAEHPLGKPHAVDWRQMAVNHRFAAAEARNAGGQPAEIPRAGFDALRQKVEEIHRMLVNMGGQPNVGAGAAN